MDLRISELPPLSGADLAATDALPIADLSASVTKKLTAKDLVQSGAALVDAGSIPGSKIASGSITALQLGTDVVTSVGLAPDSVATFTIADGAVTDAKIASVSGSKLLNDTVTAAKVSASSLDRGLNKASGAIGHSNAIAAGIRSGITFDAQGHVTSTAELAASDLPVATTTLKGAVSVPTASGLNVSATGELSHQIDIAAGTTSGISYNATGHITDAVPLVGGDLPIATATVRGAVSVPGPGLSVGATGALTHDASPAGAGVYTKVTVDARGHVSAGALLGQDDIPKLDASWIVSGEFDTTRIGYNSITAYQLADYGIAQVNQTRPKPLFAGQWWVNPVDRSAYIWVGTVDGPGSVENGYWMNLGYGSAVEQNARFGGTYDATNNVVESVNTYGTLAGVVLGQALPAPSQTNAGVYLIVTQPGTGTAPAPAEGLVAGDWIFSLGTGAEWIKIAVISGAGGLVNDEDVAVVGAGFSVPMPNVANQEEANGLLWNYCQVASAVLRGTVKPSSEVLVDPITAEMTVAVLDEGTY